MRLRIRMAWTAFAQMVGPCDDGNELSGSIKLRKFFN
jgi:hypothetical protein